MKQTEDTRELWSDQMKAMGGLFLGRYQEAAKANSSSASIKRRKRRCTK